MSDYRDDRGALRQRVEELESELERAERAKAALEAKLERTRERKQPEKSKPKKPKPGAMRSYAPLMVVAGAGVVGIWAIAAWMSGPSHPSLYPEPDELNPRPFPPPESEDWGDRGGDTSSDDSEGSAGMANTTPSPDSPFVESKSCRCESFAINAASTLAYRAVTSTDTGLTVIEAALVGARKVELRLTPGTAPPFALTPKKTRLLVACDNQHMVLAFGERAAAWNRATGDTMWIATLPEAVGGIEPGPFALECEKLRVTKGAITFKHVNGSTRLSMKDGEPVER